MPSAWSWKRGQALGEGSECRPQNRIQFPYPCDYYTTKSANYGSRNAEWPGLARDWPGSRSSRSNRRKAKFAPAPATAPAAKGEMCVGAEAEIKANIHALIVRHSREITIV